MDENQRPGTVGRRHRRHLHRSLPRLERQAHQREGADHAARAGGRRAGRHGADPEADRHQAGRPRPRHPRHDAGHQRHHRAQGRQDRAGRHRGVSRFDRDRLRAPLRAVRHLHAEAAAPGGARPALRHSRAHGRPRQRADPARRGGGARAGAQAEGGRHRGDRDRLHARLSRRQARAAHARHPGGTAARRVDLALQRGLARDPRIRALVDRRRQRLRPAGDGPLSRPAR